MLILQNVFMIILYMILLLIKSEDGDLIDLEMIKELQIILKLMKIY